MSVLALGTVAFDALETPFGKTDKIVGGAATYISLSASYFVNPVKLVSVIGEDFDFDMLEKMKSKGIQQEGLQIKKGEKSFFWKGKYHHDLNTRDTLVTELNVLENFKPEVPESYQDCDFVMLGNLEPGVQESVIKQFKKRPKLIVMDTMNFWMDIALDQLKKTISQVDVLTINDEEARQLSGEYNLPSAAGKIMDLGVKTLIIKKGEHGALLFGDNRMFFAPALPLEMVKDPTGAGDTFAGGFIGHLAKTGDISFDNMKKAVVAGSAMASFCVEEFGTENLLNLSQEKIDNRIAEFTALVRH
ncbi:PfkB family carbohydrate kinase [Luteibaculum oceani]|uniref:Sugar kinase n=1 Tax=Luteibaculum oceani TaxID=1294296 RepID=A0A5C6VNW4_9FLAO|nr:PfkB family carbohydrate kinase [Luteibaculum oceani]TXC85385.1 sugar kinase [Luteibaculum oceani]